jgi:hypothetical protein
MLLALNLNQCQDNLFTKSKILSTLISLFLNSLSFLAFHKLQIAANQITLIQLVKTLPLPANPSNWFICDILSLWKAEGILSQLLILYQIPAKIGHSKKRWVVDSSAPHSPKQWMDLWSMTPLLQRLSYVPILFWNNLQTEHDTFDGMDLCHAFTKRGSAVTSLLDIIFLYISLTEQWFKISLSYIYPSTIMSYSYYCIYWPHP